MSNYDPNQPQPQPPGQPVQPQAGYPQQPQQPAAGPGPYQQPYPQQPGAEPPPQQQPYPQPYPPAQPKKSNVGKILLIIGGVLLLLLIGCGLLFGGLFAGVMGLTQPVVDAGDNFMTALRDGNYQQAYDLCTPGVQEDLGSPEALGELIGENRPTDWNFTSRNISNDLGTLEGTATFQGVGTRPIDMELRQVNGAWRVSYFDFTER